MPPGSLSRKGNGQVIVHTEAEQPANQEKVRCMKNPLWPVSRIFRLLWERRSTSNLKPR